MTKWGWIGGFSGALSFGSIKSSAVGCGVIAICGFGEEAKDTAGWVVFLKLGFFLDCKLTVACHGEDALAIRIIGFAVCWLVPPCGTELVVAGGSAVVVDEAAELDGFDGWGCSCFLFVDVVGGSKDEVSGIRKVSPFGRNVFINKDLLAKIRERSFREGFDVVSTGVVWIAD